MIQPRDIAPVLAIARADGDWTVRSLAAAIDAPPVSVQRSIQRLAAVGLMSRSTRRVNAAVLDEFVRHAIRFVAPCTVGPSTLGAPTAWAAEPLRSQLWVDEGDEVPVWPSAAGSVRGFAVTPVAANAVRLINHNPEIATDLTLIDAVRMGRARERAMGADLLMQRLTGVSV